MRRRYQIDQQGAVQQFRQLAREENPNIQMIFPMAEVVGLLQEGVGHLLREAGLALMNLVMEEEVRHLAGERHQQHPERRAHRWGKEDGYCVVDGQKVPIRRTRLRSPEHREQRLGSYELFQRSAPREHAVWDKMMRGLSTRNYGAVVKEFREAYGVEKSAVSDNFIEASREKLRELMERRLGELRCVGCCAGDFASDRSCEEGCCRGSEGCVAYDGRESLTFNGVPGNVCADAATELEPEWGSPNDSRKRRLV